MRYVSCFMASVLLILTCGCGTGGFLIRPVPARYSLSETTIQKDKGWAVVDKIAIIDIDGAIMNSASNGLFESGDNPVSVFCEKLDRAAADQHVKAVVLRINSPGGSVSATELMYHKLLQFKTQKKVPVIAVMLDVAASGGYYLACGCDRIYAAPSTLTGSIGTIMQAFSIEKTLGFIGVKPYTIKSGQMKDMASPLHDMRDDEKEILQHIIDSSYERFLDVVAKHRPIPLDTLRPLADGRIYVAQDALDHKLIDEIGFPQDAIQYARQQAGIRKAQIIMYHYPYQRMVNLYDTASTQPAGPTAISINLPDWLRADAPQLLYLWKPSLD